MKPIQLNGDQYMVSDKLFNVISGIVDLADDNEITPIDADSFLFSVLTDEDIENLLDELWANRKFVAIYDKYAAYDDVNELTGIDLARYHGYKGKVHSMLLCYCGHHDLDRVLSKLKELWS
jgi:hypothetical protein